GAIHGNTARVGKHSRANSFATEGQQFSGEAVPVFLPWPTVRDGSVWLLERAAYRVKCRRQYANRSEHDDDQSEEWNRQQQPDPFRKLAAEVNADHARRLAREFVRRDQLAVTIRAAYGPFRRGDVCRRLERYGRSALGTVKSLWHICSAMFMDTDWSFDHYA